MDGAWTGQGRSPATLPAHSEGAGASHHGRENDQASGEHRRCRSGIGLQLTWASARSYERGLEQLTPAKKAPGSAKLKAKKTREARARLKEEAAAAAEARASNPLFRCP